MLGTLLKHKLLLTAVSLVAALAAIMTSYRISLSPAGVERRAHPTGAATAQLLVDSPQSALANLKQNTAPLSTRAGVFAEFMASNDVRAAIARQAHVPVSQIVARGPFDDPSTAPSGAAAPDPTTGTVGPKPYILTYVAQETAPIVTVFAQAPQPSQAAKLANAAVSGTQAYVTRLQTQGRLPLTQRVIIRALGSAQAGTVGGKPKLPLMVLAFIAVFCIGSFGILVFDGVRRRRGEWSADTPDDGWDGDEEFDSGEPPVVVAPLRAASASADTRFHASPPPPPPAPVVIEGRGDGYR